MAWYGGFFTKTERPCMSEPYLSGSPCGFDMMLNHSSRDALHCLGIVQHAGRENHIERHTLQTKVPYLLAERPLCSFCGLLATAKVALLM